MTARSYTPLLLCIAAAALVLGIAGRAPALDEGSTGAKQPGSIGKPFPALLETIDGEPLDLRRLAKHSTVVVVTAKAHWCPVCARQLLRIDEHRAALERCGLTFVVLAPGTPEDVAKLRRATGVDFPFVVDPELQIAASLDLVLGPGELKPAILMLDSSLDVAWVQSGRAPGFYGDGALAEEVGCWRKTLI